ncbi:hypothetical protein DV736_g1518, partial [Chaetothyriales sp. CBS 134916]
MPIFKSLQQKLCGRTPDAHDAKAEQQVSASHASTDNIEVPAASHQTPPPPPPPQTHLHYIRTQWTENSTAADTIDSEDLRESPNGPAHIVDNLNVQELESEMSHTDESVYHMRSAQFPTLQPPPPSPALQLPHPLAKSNETTTTKPAMPPKSHPKRYNPPFSGDSDDSDDSEWRVSAARLHKRSASLRNLGATHLRDRHYPQTRLTTPQQALLATLQQANVDLRALELENDAVMDGVRMVRRRANMLQGELTLRRIRNERTKTSMDELRAEISRQRTELNEERKQIEANLEHFRRSQRQP